MASSDDFKTLTFSSYGATTDKRDTGRDDIGKIQTKNREVFQIMVHATSRVQNLPEIGRLANFSVKTDKNVYENREPSSEIGWASKHSMSTNT